MTTLKIHTKSQNTPVIKSKSSLVTSSLVRSLPLATQQSPTSLLSSSDSPTAPSVLSRSTNSPSDYLSSPSDQSGSESESPHSSDHDKILLSDEDLAESPSLQISMFLNHQLSRRQKEPQ